MIVIIDEDAILECSTIMKSEAQLCNKTHPAIAVWKTDNAKYTIEYPNIEERERLSI